MRAFIISSFLLFALCCSAQTDTIYSFVEQMPEFPGGNKAMMGFLGQQITYHAYERDNNIQGKVLLRFFVDIDGSVKDVRVVKAVSPGIDSEAVRVVRLLPKFAPGKQQGKEAKVYFNLPLSFKLTEPDTSDNKMINDKIARDPYYKDAIRMVQQKQYGVAITMLDLSINSFPYDYLSYELIGDCWAEQGFHTVACQYYAEAAKLGSRSKHDCSRTSMTDLDLSLSFSNPNKPDTLKNSANSDSIYTFVEKNPQFPGGDGELVKDILKNLYYPEYPKIKPSIGKVVLRFVIDLDGSIKNVVVVGSNIPELNKDAIKAAKKLPNFVPGEQHGRPVKVYFNLPITCRLITN